MTEYRWDRRIDPTAPLKPVSKNEATEGSDLRREQAWERAREAIADERRKQESKGRRQFSDLVKKKKG